ncbi:MAG: N-acetylmuramoyl-L-alanine amidase [Desulfobacterales bacterium]
MSRKIEKVPVMPMFFKLGPLTSVRCIFVVFAIFVTLISFEAEAQTSYFKKIKKTVVLDPGHGGHDSGARGPDGNLEKDMVLKLANALADEIKNEYEVVLTRTGDYGLDIQGRTSMANHLEADLFISIHNGGSFRHKAGGITIFYFRPLPNQDSASDIESAKPFGDSEDPITWDHIQGKHINSSITLAKSIQSRIKQKVTFSRCNVQAAPLLVLRSADMPAVLVEAGYLTNPAEEKALSDPDVRSQLAESIGRGIHDFLSKFE